MAQLLPDVVFRLLDSSANPISGGTATFYLSGTSTLTPIYSDSGLTTALPNPLSTNSGGLFINGSNAVTTIYIDDTISYRAVFKDASGTTIRDIDPVFSGLTSPEAPSGTRTEMTALFIAASQLTVTTTGYSTVGIGGAEYVRTSLATITAGTYPAASYFRSLDRFMPNGSTDNTNGGYWLNANETLDFYQFGAVGDATVTNDSAAIIAAILFSKLTGRLLRPAGTYRVEEKIVINCNGFDGRLCTLNVYGAPAIACEISTGDGANPVTIFALSNQRDIHAPALTNMTKPATGWAAQGEGLRVVNAQNLRLFLGAIANFAVGLHMTSYSQLCSYNTVYVGMLLNNMVNLQIDVGDAGGASNCNLFVGGHYFHYTAEGTAVAGVYHVYIVPHATRSIVNNNGFHGASLEGTTQQYHARDGGMESLYLDCRWETVGGPKFLQDYAGQAGQGGNHTIAYGYGVDENSYLTITNTPGASTRMTIRGVGLDRCVKGGPTDMTNTVGASEPIFRFFPPASNLNSVNRTTEWAAFFAPDGYSGKQTTDVYARFSVNHNSGAVRMGPGTVTPAVGFDVQGTGGIAEVGNFYAPSNATAPGNVAGLAARWFDGTTNNERWKTRLPGGDTKALAYSEGLEGVTINLDVAATLVASITSTSVSTKTQIWSTPLAANRAVTLSTSGAFAGAMFRITRTAAATGAFNLNVGTGPLKALAVGQWCEVTYDGSAWMLSSFGSL